MIRLLLVGIASYAAGLLVARHHVRQAAAELRQQWDEASRQQDVAHGLDDSDWLGEWPPRRDPRTLSMNLTPVEFLALQPKGPIERFFNSPAKPEVH